MVFGLLTVRTRIRGCPARILHLHIPCISFAGAALATHFFVRTISVHGPGLNIVGLLQLSASSTDPVLDVPIDVPIRTDAPTLSPQASLEPSMPAKTGSPATDTPSIQPSMPAKTGSPLPPRNEATDTPSVQPSMPARTESPLPPRNEATDTPSVQPSMPARTESPLPPRSDTPSPTPVAWVVIVTFSGPAAKWSDSYSDTLRVRIPPCKAHCVVRRNGLAFPTRARVDGVRCAVSGVLRTVCHCACADCMRTCT